MKYRISFSWVAAAVVAFAVPVLPSASAAVDPVALHILSSDLPAGVTLKRATVDETGDALYTAASNKPGMVMALFEAAVAAKWPAPHHGALPCPDLIKLLKRSAAAVPDKSRDLLELAESLDPGCTSALDDLLNDPAFAGRGGNGGFGAGLGSDFPGSPGFTGSPPGGTTALPPPSPTPVTSAVNG